MTGRGEPLGWLQALQPDDACIEWPFSASERRGGYGQVRYRGTVRRAHRVSFELHFGRPPRTLLRHRCDNPRCVNPRHLIEGSAAENMADAVQRGRLPRRTERPNGKVTPDQVREIRSSAETGRAIAARLGISESLVSAIRTGRRHYDLLTGPWRRGIGPIHPDDPDLRETAEP